MADVALLLRSTKKNFDVAGIADREFGLKVFNQNIQGSTTNHDVKKVEQIIKVRLERRKVGQGKENNMKRATSMSAPMTRKRRLERIDACKPSVNITTLRRCFSDLDSTGDSNSRTSDGTVSNTSDRSDVISPSKELQEAMECPPSPTANLRMLFSAVSPEIRKMQSEQQLQIEQKEENDVVADDSSLETEYTSSQESDFSKSCTGSRKEKSLGLLCQK